VILIAALLSVALIALPMWALAGDGGSYDRAAYSAAVGRIGQAWAMEQFDELERMHEDFLDPAARTPDGTWMMEAFEVAFDPVLGSDGPARIEKTFAAWKQKTPDSAVRPLLEAYAWQIRAWKARGMPCSVHGPKVMLRVFDELLFRAQSALAEGGARARRSPLWYTVSLRIAGARESPGLDGLLAEAEAAIPGYPSLYSARLEFLLPEWGGDYERVDRFIRDVAARTQGVEGKAFYARLYVGLARSRDCVNRFDESSVSWPDMKASFEDMIQRHPDPWNKNLFATFACRARDLETTRRLLGELGTLASLGAWSSSISNESCRQMIKPRSQPAVQT